MVAKIVCTLLLASCLIQVIGADVVKTMEDLASNAMDKVSDTVQNVEQAMDKKIEDIKEEAEKKLSDMPSEIAKKVEDMANKQNISSEKTEGCVKEATNEASKTVESVKASMNDCLTNFKTTASEKINKVKLDIKSYKDWAKGILSDMSNCNIFTCPVKLLELTGIIPRAMESAKTLMQIAEACREIPLDAMKCAYGVSYAMAQGGSSIVAKAAQCLTSSS